MAHGYAAVKEHGLAKFAAAFSLPVLSCCCTIIGPSAPAAVNHARTLIRGDRLPTGVARSHISKAVRKLIRTASDCGAQAMPEGTRWCWVLRIGV